MPTTAGLPPGTLVMLILRVLRPGPLHGYAIAQRIHALSSDVLRVEEGALYPALHRLESRGLLASEWGVSDNNRRAKFYTLTRSGRRQLQSETSYWRSLSSVVERVLRTAPEGGGR